MEKRLTTREIELRIAVIDSEIDHLVWERDRLEKELEKREEDAAYEEELMADERRKEAWYELRH